MIAEVPRYYPGGGYGAALYVHVRIIRAGTRGNVLCYAYNMPLPARAYGWQSFEREAHMTPIDWFRYLKYKRKAKTKLITTTIPLRK